MLNQIEHYISEARSNKWYRYFAVFCRISLAIGFIIAGMVKILGERFASGLSEIHPMGSYLEVLHHTGYYYTFIGVAQVLAAILLLINRTALLGALLYFPIIVNIWILSLAVRFDGSFVSSTWMVYANTYLLVYNYDRLKILWIRTPSKEMASVPSYKPKKFDFPFGFLGLALVLMAIPIVVFQFGFEVLPRNTLDNCNNQFVGTPYETIGNEFCKCVHHEGQPLDTCIEQFKFQKSQLPLQ